MTMSIAVTLCPLMSPASPYVLFTHCTLFSHMTCHMTSCPFPSFDDAPCLTRCDHLTDLSLDGNPLANAADHRQAVIYRINQLHMLDQVSVTVSVYTRHPAWCDVGVACGRV